MKYIYTICLLISLFVLSARGQEKDSVGVSPVRTKDNMITLDPLRHIAFYNISYTRAISSDIAIAVGAQNPDNNIGVTAGLRYYMIGTALQGMYISPMVFISDDNFMIDALAGWQWFPEDYFTFGFGAGLSYDNSGNSVSPALRLELGYPW
jgi:hypothetical protein